MNNVGRKVIGNSTRVSFPELYLANVPARIDTGARLSSIWATAIERDGVLVVTFFGEGSPLHKPKPLLFHSYERLVVSSSMGQTQQRYKVKLLISIGGKRVRAAFTLADRSSQVYPILVGRNVLRGKFIVDVKVGKSLREAEQAHVKHMQTELHDADQEEEE
jgi:hypothetical protein